MYMIRYCSRCIQPDTRPEMILHDDGICAACRNLEDRKKINWDEREEEIKKIAQWAKDHSTFFDCVVGVSGGKDSTFQALYARDVLGLKPLLVNAAPDGITDVGRANLENLVQMGFDLISVKPNPVINRITMKDAFYKYGNPAKPTEYYLWASAYRVAINYKIPLVIQGENGAAIYGLKRLVNNGDALQALKQNTIKDDVNIWITGNVSKKDLFFWTPPTHEEIETSGIRAIYLDYYAREWSWSGNTKFSVKNGLQSRKNHQPQEVGYLSPYGQIDSDIWPVNNLLKYYKYGFGGVTDELCLDLRSGNVDQENLFFDLGGKKLTRETAIELATQYDGKCSDKYIKQFCDYINITEKEFWNHVDNNIVNKNLFRKDPSTGKWIPKFKVGIGLVE